MNVINPTGGGSGGYFPSLFVKNIESRCSVYLTNGTRGYNGVWTDRGMTRLPSAYQEVDYIESSGTQYIDTNYNGDAIIECKVNYTSLISSVHNALIGRQHKVGDTWYGNYLRTKYNDSHKYNVTSSVCSYSPTTNTELTIVSNLKSNNQQLIVNESDKGVAHTTNLGDGSTNYSLFAMSTNNGESISEYSNIKLYYFKIYNDTTLVRDYIPCYRKSDDVIGLYDLVNGVFYENQGTGDFTKGKDVNYYGFYFPKIKDLGTYTLGCLDRLEQTLFEETIEITEPIENTFTFPYYLYKDGAELNVRTGGWETRAFTNSSSAKRYGICTASQVNLNEYRKLCIEYIPLQIGSSMNRLGYLGYSDTQLSSWTDIPAERNIIPVSTRETISHYEIDISNVMDWKYITIYDGVISSWNTPTLNKLSHAIQVIMYYNSSNEYNVAHRKIWLE